MNPTETPPDCGIDWAFMFGRALAASVKDALERESLAQILEYLVADESNKAFAEGYEMGWQDGVAFQSNPTTPDSWANEQVERLTAEQ